MNQVQSAPGKEFERIIRGFSAKYGTAEIFADFCEMAAISLSNPILRDEKREARYLEIVKRYKPAEAQEFPKLLGCVIDGLERGPCDFLGEQFMQLELGNHWKGQFFTPYHLCRAMAEMTLDGCEGIIAEKGFISLCEPASGAGATIIAAAETLKARGINYQERMHVTTTDVDRTAAHMCYIQLSLASIPAIVQIGNTLSNEVSERFFTPMHHLGLWDGKLRRGYTMDSRMAGTSDAQPAAPEAIHLPDQPVPYQEREGQLSFL